LRVADEFSDHVTDMDAVIHADGDPFTDDYNNKFAVAYLYEYCGSIKYNFADVNHDSDFYSDGFLRNKEHHGKREWRHALYGL
jgi:hypothetical protein